jgi:homogentisate 1,2-dioxygenase
VSKRNNLPADTPALRYQHGFGNEHSTEAVVGALPIGQNSPQQVPLGLYAEQLSATAFTAPRSHNRRSWVYRVRPSAAQGLLASVPDRQLPTAPLITPVEPNRVRWGALDYPKQPTDFLGALITYCAAGNTALNIGASVFGFAANADMTSAFADFDGELMVVAQEGELHLDTELGQLRITPGEIAVIPRGIRFRVRLGNGTARGYVCENHGQLFELPELGPIGANGLAHPRDFRYPVAWFDADHLDQPTELIVKSGGALWQTQLGHSPFDVVAWRGNNAPYAYDLARFNTINTVSYDHPDPSIFTVLTSPSAVDGTANVDFVIFPPRWMVAEHTFRPPWFHRNVMSEFMGLITGAYDAKADGFVPGGASLHNAMTPHGPDATTYEKASTVELSPHKITDTMAFMFETSLPFALSGDTRLTRHHNYDQAWAGLPRQFTS